MKQIMKKHWGLVGLSMLLPLSAAQAADKGAATSVPAIQQQAFQLGYALEAPTAETEQFLQAAKDLKLITDDTEATLAVGKLAKQSVSLRASELRAYRQATQRLHAMNAPADLQTWTEHTAARLAAPLVVSQKEKEESDPNTATVLGTIDESQDIKINADLNMPTLRSWVKLTQGGDAVWATALGQMTAQMHTAFYDGQSLPLSRTSTMRLRDTAPFGTPGPVLDVLTDLTPHLGNLATLVTLPSPPITPKDMKGPQATLLDAYAAGPLAAAIDKSQ
jgi:hypothetical protein